MVAEGVVAETIAASACREEVDGWFVMGWDSRTERRVVVFVKFGHGHDRAQKA